MEDKLIRAAALKASFANLEVKRADNERRSVKYYRDGVQYTLSCIAPMVIDDAPAAEPESTGLRRMSNPCFSPFDASPEYLFYCSACGASVRVEDLYCRMCGRKIDRTTIEEVNDA